MLTILCGVLVMVVIVLVAVIGYIFHKLSNIF